MPQGSCLGPVAYLLYASSLGEEVITPPEPPAPAPNDPEEKSPTAEKINLHSYADDHGIKKKFKPVCDEIATTKLLSDCLTKIKSWIDLIKLKINDAKTEYIQACRLLILFVVICNWLYFSRTELIFEF